jgi:uncharacterized protein YgiM (DUF1202 family)
MSRTQMQQAQQLIKQGRYDEARRILRRIDTPAAREWLAKLDQRAPQAPRRRSGGGSAIRGFFGYVLTILLSAGLTVGVLAAMVFASSSAPRTGSSTDATEIAQNVTPSATPDVRTGVVISNQNINVRSGPGTSNNSIASLVPGTEVEIIAESDDGQWFNVRLADGSTGWVAVDLLNAEALPTSVADASTTAEPPDVTQVAEVACTPEAAQAWYDANRPAINRILFTQLQAEDAVNSGRAIDYAQFQQIVRENRSTFEDTEYPDCLETARATFLAGFQALDNSFQNRILSFPNEAVSELNLAVQRNEDADNILVNDIGILTFRGDCAAAEVWYAGIEPDVTLYLTTIDGIAVDTAPSAEIRQDIFDLNELRDRLSVVSSPTCAAAANTRLQASVTASIRLFQNIMAEESTSTIQQDLAVMVSEATEFINEMRDLGVRIT